jgi:manganese/zinc/iron transport system permease protein
LALDLTMMGAVAVVTIVGLPIVGVVLMAAMIILPAATARLWTHRLHTLLLVAGGIGVAMGAGGVRVGHDLSAGPAIVLTGAAMFVVSLLVAPQRGAIAMLWSEWRLRLRVANDHLLRSLYELSEPSLPRAATIPVEQLAEHRHTRPWMLRWLLDRGEGDGLLEQTGDAVTLTPLGMRRAAETAKRHRMWEIYMMEFAGSAPDHVDRSADDVEHLLPEGLLVELEARLAKAGRMPKMTTDVPASPHEVTHGATP